MRKHIKLISAMLAIVMVFSFCACSKKNTGSGAVHNDAESKPEYQGTIDTPVPTTTEPADPTNTVTTEPTDSGDKTVVSYSVKDIMDISENCIGHEVTEVTNYLVNTFGLFSFELSDSNTNGNGTPQERYIRNMNVDIAVDGVIFKSIGIHALYDGTVHSIDYSVRETAIFTQNEAFDTESMYNTLYPQFCAYYGSPDDEYDSSWVEFDKNGQNGWRYYDCWISLFWGMGCQGVTGNDQLVIAIECDDPSNHVAGNTASPAPTLDAGNTVSSLNVSLSDTYDLMMEITGKDTETAEDMLNDFFAFELGNPEVGVDDNSVAVSYVYNVEVMIEGYYFYKIELDFNEDKIYYIGFTNDTDSSDILKECCSDFRKLMTDKFGVPAMEYPLSEDNDLMEFYDYHAGSMKNASLGSYYSSFTSSVWFCFTDDHLR